MQDKNWSETVLEQLNYHERSQAWLARRLKIDRSTLNKMLHGDRKFPEAKRELLASILNLKEEHIFGN